MLGEARRKSQKLSDMVAAEPRCIYCASAPATIEHMPPLSMFKGRSRPNGLEFAACESCNNGTNTADLVAGFMSRLSQADVPGNWMIQANLRDKRLIHSRVPGLLAEIFNDQTTTQEWHPNRFGILEKKMVLRVESPRLVALLRVFAAKMGMALFREHIGHALPMTGGVFTQHFLNAGLAEDQAKAILGMLPLGSTLQQGRFTVGEQFAYRYNSDEKSLVAALIGFHSNLHLWVIASADPELLAPAVGVQLGDLTRPGQLVSAMPAKPLAIVMPSIPLIGIGAPS